MSIAQRVLPLYGHPKGWQTDIYRKRMAFVLITSRADEFRRDFMDWLSRNYHVWEAFEYEADRIWERGHRRWSARTIGEYLRHETALREGANQNGWKLNDHAWPDLARLYMAFHPEREGYFERRSGQSAARAR